MLLATLFVKQNAWASCNTIVTTLFYITNYNSFALSPQNGVFNISKNDKYIQAGYEIKVLNL